MKKTIAILSIALLCSCATSLKQPKSLKEGDLIGVIHLSSRNNPETDTATVRAKIKSMGFRVLYGEHLLDQTDPSFGARDETRAADFMKMVENREVKAILMFRGGYGAVRTLDYIDWRKVRRNPKWIVGYSDVTMLHLAVQKAGLQTIHGDMPITFGDDTVSMSSLATALKGELKSINIEPNLLNQNGIATGRLTGGNLSLVYAAGGTPEDIKEEGNVIFIEDLSEKLYHIDRMMQNLERSGKLKRAKAILVGQFTDISQLERFDVKSAEELIKNYTKKYNIPVIFGFPAGHDRPNLAIYLGRKVRVTVTNEIANIEFL
ncbi:Muramoyltetrapeptide carboxypeptidase [Mucinivorans hirudinis]|uniref:Muramoyltetrapeptide carboxypeptidase n=1 Tax=Mucinivorans hirudinis TaxID=1433126 RepID=A0A060RB96_9BACT|nr:Muramoyltetrapeptide carboxypeptidase [Mucinivorans hirudinis]